MANDGGPAFPPTPYEAKNERFAFAHGMSLRDYFAAQALLGQVVGRAVVIASAIAAGKEFEHSDVYRGAAQEAYRHADAMLKAREEPR